jgi:hypothetical protein
VGSSIKNSHLVSRGAISPDKSPYIRQVKFSFLSFVGLTLTGFGLGIALMSIILWMCGFSPADLSDFSSLLTPQHALVLGWANVGHQLGAFALPGLVFFWINQEHPSLTRHPTAMAWLLGASALLISAGVIEALSQLNLGLLSLFPKIAAWAHQGEASAWQMQSALLSQTDIGGLLQVVIIMSVVPAFCEEIFFRGALFQWLLQWMSPLHVIIVSGFVFSLFHFQFEGFLPRWAMGMVLGFLTYKSQSLWPAILGHFLNNLSGIFIFYQFSGKLTPPEDHWMSSPFWWALSALMLLGWCWGVNKLISPKIPNSPREPS